MRKSAIQVDAAPARVEFEIRIDRAAKGRRRVRQVQEVPQPITGGVPDVPKATQLLVVAYWWERLIAEGKVRDYAEIARLTGLSRARVTQIMDLTFLPLEEQDKILSGMRGRRSKTLNP